MSPTNSSRRRPRPKAEGAPCTPLLNALLSKPGLAAYQVFAPELRAEDLETHRDAQQIRAPHVEWPEPIEVGNASSQLPFI